MKKVILFIVTIFISYSSFAQDYFVKTSGDVLLFTIPVVAIGSTLVIGDKEGTWQFLKGLALNQGVTFGLKSIIKEERPDLSNNRSFPSGHTSTTFQSAAFLQRRYGWRYGIPAYALASYTGFTRLNANKHYFKDVLIGAIIGVGSAYLFTTPNQKEHMELSFSKEKDNYLIQYSYKF